MPIQFPKYNIEEHEKENERVRFIIDDIYELKRSGSINDGLIRAYCSAATEIMKKQKHDICLFMKEKYTNNKRYYLVCQSYQNNMVRLKNCRRGK